MKKYDLIIIGAGPSGIFTALETKRINPNVNILVIEKGRNIKQRTCPMRRTKKCFNCVPCNITTGFAGAGAWSDGKMSLSPEVGGELPSYIGNNKTVELIKYVDDIYLSFGADKNIYGIENQDKIKDIKRKALESNLHLVECPIRHMGTEKGNEIYTKIQDYLESIGIEFSFLNPVKDLIIEGGIIKGVIADKEYYADKVVAGVGREGSEFFKNMCEKYGIDTIVGTVDVGVRVEVNELITKKLTDLLYEGKLVYYTPTFDDKVRTFCTNPNGEVSSEYYEDHLAVVNGHSYKNDDLKTENTNFALLVSLDFTEPFNTPIEYGKHIAKLGNMLSGGKILVQRYEDFKRGRRTTEERLLRNKVQPTLKDAIPGDLSLVLPYRIMKDIDEMLIALDKISPGMINGGTLLYGIEVKFYSNKVKVNDDFETNIKGLYVAGDGAGITRGLMQASVNGVYIARKIVE